MINTIACHDTELITVVKSFVLPSQVPVKTLELFSNYIFTVKFLSTVVSNPTNSANILKDIPLYQSFFLPKAVNRLLK